MKFRVKISAAIEPDESIAVSDEAEATAFEVGAEMVHTPEDSNALVFSSATVSIGTRKTMNGVGDNTFVAITNLREHCPCADGARIRVECERHGPVREDEDTWVGDAVF